MGGKAKLKLRVIEGGGTREPGAPFTSSAILTNHTDWRASDNGDSPYSAPIQFIHTLFDASRETANHRNFYIFLNGVNELKGFVLPEALPQSAFDTFLSKNPAIKSILILTLDLSKPFDHQIRSGHFDPETSKGWKQLIDAPHDCLEALSQKPQNLSKETGQPNSLAKRSWPKAVKLPPPKTSDDGEHGAIFLKIKENFNAVWKHNEKILIVMSDANNNLIYSGHKTPEEAFKEAAYSYQSGAVIVAALDTRKTFEEQCPTKQTIKYTEKWQLERHPILAVRGFEKFTSSRRQSGFPPQTP